MTERSGPSQVNLIAMVVATAVGLLMLVAWLLFPNW
jgi:hypothetical protein